MLNKLLAQRILIRVGIMLLLCGWGVVITTALAHAEGERVMSPAAQWQAATAAPQAGERCFATHNSGGTVFMSVDAQAVRDAVAAAPAGGTVKLAGYCAGVQAQGGTTQTVLINKSLTLAGGYTTTNWTTPNLALNATTLDAQGEGRVISTTNVAVTLQGFTVTNGYINVNVTNFAPGGGVYAAGAMTLSDMKVSNNTLTGTSIIIGGGGIFFNGPANVSNTSFNNNTTSSWGGGAYFDDTANVTGTTFINNSAPRGGGAYFGFFTNVTNTIFGQNSATYDGGGAWFIGNATVRNTEFLYNSAMTGGGAKFDTGVSVISSTFKGNSAIDGGGAYFEAANIVLNSTFSYNYATGRGGGAFVLDEVAITSTIFSRNSANQGGGVYFDYFSSFAQRRLVNVRLDSNAASLKGAALYVYNAAPLHILHTTIAHAALMNGTAVYVLSGTVYLTNTIIAAHTVGLERVGGLVRENYNLFSGVTTPYSGAITSGGNSFTGDAGFVGPATDNYHLGSWSAALNAGTNAGVTSDFEGENRPMGAWFDIGYDEHNPTLKCFVESNGDSVTDFISSDAQAVRDAVNFAIPGSTLRIAGYCAGVRGSEVVTINKALTLRGGYTTTNGWATYNPQLNPTLLSAQGDGRVITTTNVPVTLQGLGVTRGCLPQNNPGNGGGIYAVGAMTLIEMQVYSNSVEPAMDMDDCFYTYDGGGAYFASAANVISSTFLNNESGLGDGGGAYFSGTANITNTNFANGGACEGGGAYFWGQANIYNSAFSGNGFCTRGGGAIFNGPANVLSSTFSNNQGGDWGGGAMFRSTAHVTNSIFSGNDADLNGGGAFFVITANVTNTTFSGNYSMWGAGAYFSNTANVTNTRFSGNGGTRGGGAWFNSTGNVVSSTFSGNGVSLNGGGAEFRASANVTGSAFLNNSAYRDGGGAIFDGLAGTPGITYNLTNTIFSDNSADFGDGGGAYFVLPNPGWFVNVLFARNQAAYKGAAIYVEDANPLRLIHTTLVGPTPVLAQALYVVSGTTYLTNTIIATHTVGIERVAGTVNENYTLFSNITIPYSGVVNSGGNSLTGTAAFYNISAYTLTANSLAVDRGTNAGVSSDYFGNPRPRALGYDIGYNESPYTITYPLTVTRTGNGNGSVGSSPAGITCSPTCVATYTHGTLVTLIATPTLGSTFTGWTGACSGAGSCVATMTTPRSVTATFTLITHTLSVTRTGNGSGSVTSSPGGITCSPTCAASFNYGTVVTLTATPLISSTFTGWTGACSGIGVCVVTMTTPRSVTATFTLITHTLSVTHTSNGSGSVTSNPGGITCSPTCAASFNYGTVVTLTATPLISSTFTGWTGACSGTGVCVVTMTTPRSVTATFTLITHTLSVTRTGNGSGSVTSNPGGIMCSPTCAASFNYGTGVTLTAAPTVGSTFTGWTGACSGLGACVVIMTTPRSVTATFTLITHTLSVTRTGNGNGSVTSSPGGITCSPTCSTSFNYGTVITLTATPLISSTFTGWSGACSGTGFCVVTMTASRSVTATFTLITHTLSVTRTGSGSVTSNPGGITCSPTCSTSFNYGTVITLTATPLISSTFTGWTGACSGTGICVVTMTAARSVTATFTLITHTLSITRTGNGSVTSSPAGIACTPTCAASFNYGTVVTLTATPLISSTFTGWTGACSGLGACVVTMTTPRSVTATFTLNTYTITPTTGPGGSILPGTPQTVNHGASRAFTLTPNAGYVISGVWVDGSYIGITNTYLFTNVTANHTLSATFTPGTLLHLIVFAGDNDPLSSTNLDAWRFDTIKSLQDATAQNASKRVVILVDRGGTAPDKVYEIHNGLVLRATWPTMPAEVNTTDPATLAGFIQWARGAYPADRVTFSFIGHGLYFAPETDWSTITPTVRAPNNGLFPFPAKIWGDPDFTDNNPKGMLSIYALGEALRLATNDGANKLDVVDLMLCYQLSLELTTEVYSYTHALVGGPGYVYFTSTLPATGLQALDVSQTPTQMAGALVQAYDAHLPVDQHPRILAAIDTARVALAIDRANYLSFRLLQELTNPGTRDATRAHILAAYQNTAFSDTDCDFACAVPDAVVDAPDFFLNLSTEFGMAPGGVGLAAFDAASRLNTTIITRTVRSGAPWFNPNATWDFANASGLSMYGDWQGVFSPTLTMTVLNGISYWYTHTVTTDNPAPFAFVAPNIYNASWADVLAAYWAGTPITNGLCLPIFPAVLETAELTALGVAQPWTGTVRLNQVVTPMVKLATSNPVHNPLIAITITQGGAAVFTNTVEAGFLLTGTYAIKATHVWTPTQMGAYTLTYAVDVRNQVLEANENDNTYTTALDFVGLATEPPIISVVPTPNPQQQWFTDFTIPVQVSSVAGPAVNSLFVYIYRYTPNNPAHIQVPELVSTLDIRNITLPNVFDIVLPDALKAGVYRLVFLPHNDSAGYGPLVAMDINYLPPNAQLGAGAETFFRFTLNEGEQVQLSLATPEGLTLYAWVPSNPWTAQVMTGAGNLDLTPTEAGEYVVSVFNLLAVSTTFTLTGTRNGGPLSPEQLTVPQWVARPRPVFIAPIPNKPHFVYLPFVGR